MPPTSYRMIYISRQEHFNAAHKLHNPKWSDERNKEVFGPCANTNWHGHNYDLIVTVEANAAERIQRLVSIRGYTEEHARARIVAQGAEDGRTSIANVVIRTDGSLAATHEAVDALWRRLTCPPVEAPCLGREPTVCCGFSDLLWGLGGTVGSRRSRAQQHKPVVDERAQLRH